MKASKQKKLAAVGWRTGTVAEFLELTDAEALAVELRLALADILEPTRADKAP